MKAWRKARPLAGQEKREESGNFYIGSWLSSQLVVISLPGQQQPQPWLALSLSLRRQKPPSKAGLDLATLTKRPLSAGKTDKQAGLSASQTGRHMVIPVSCSIAGQQRVKWPSYRKSKGESIRSCGHLRGKHTQGRKTRIYRPWQCERHRNSRGRGVLGKLPQTHCDRNFARKGLPQGSSRHLPPLDFISCSIFHLLLW